MPPLVLLRLDNQAVHGPSQRPVRVIRQHTSFRVLDRIHPVPFREEHIDNARSIARRI